MFVWNDEVVFDESGEGGPEFGLCHEGYLDGKVDRWWLVRLVGEGILELVECYGSVWFLYVLAQSPEKKEVLDVVFHAPEGSECQERLFGLRCKVKQCEEG